jgi:hypothetical protein
MFKRLIRGFGMILKAELLLWAVLLAFAGICYILSQIF